MIRLYQFYQELEARKVRKTMAIYVGVSLTAFGILKAFVETYSLPTTLIPYVLTILTCGCVSAFVFAWFHGKGEKQGFHKREIVIHFLVAIVTVAISINVGSKARRVASRASETIASSPLTTVTGSKTIAVLPFLDMSPNKDQEYFSDGLSEELLNVLAKNPGLRVTSRTSSFSFKGKNEDIKTIAAKLNVKHILEGSVRKSGNLLRITAQLIDVETDAHLWSKIYDGTLENIFALQDSISGSVAEALKIALRGKESKIQRHITDPQAYNLYLLGKHFFSLRSDDNWKKAAGYYEKALAIDSNYAPAWVGLSKVHSSQADKGSLPPGEGYTKARLEIEKALELDSSYADAHSQLGWIKRAYEWDWTGADECYRRALELEPGNVSIITNAAVLAATLGRVDEAIKLTRHAIELNPLSIARYNNLGFLTLGAGLLDESEMAFKKSLELNPQYPLGHMQLGLVYLEKKKLDLALAEMTMVTEPEAKTYGLALVYHALGKRKEADDSLAAYVRDYQEKAAYSIAELYAFRYETDKAFEWLERAYDQRDPGCSEIKSNSLMRNVRKDPRYAAFLKRMKLPL